MTLPFEMGAALIKSGAVGCPRTDVVTRCRDTLEPRCLVAAASLAAPGLPMSRHTVARLPSDTARFLYRRRICPLRSSCSHHPFLGRQTVPAHHLQVLGSSAA